MRIRLIIGIPSGSDAFDGFMSWSSFSTPFVNLLIVNIDFLQKIIGASLWKHTMPISFFYTLMRLTLYKKLFKDKNNTEVRLFNLTDMYIDGVLSINNPKFAHFVPLIY